MRKERILAFNTSVKLSEEEINHVSAAGAGSGNVTTQITFGVNSGNDVILDGGADG